MRMSKEKGFTVVEVILAVVVLGLLGYIGYTAWQTANKKADPQAAQTTSQEKKTVVDPYAGWREYCSTPGGYCLKYPTDWTFSEEETPDPSIKAARFTPPASDFTIQYNPFLSGIGGMVEPNTIFFTTFSLKKLSGAEGLNVAQGAYINKFDSGSAYSPEWFVVWDEDLENHYKLKVGEAVDVGFFVPRFDDTQVIGIRTGEEFATIEEVKKWFEGKDLEIAGLVLESFSKKN